MLSRKIIQTEDGSPTIYLPEWNESYHSRHGAVQEAYHVFIAHGLKRMVKKEIKILEIGFGTGLNALITTLESPRDDFNIQYTGLEKFPVKSEEYKILNYPKIISQIPENSKMDLKEIKNIYLKIMESKWGDYQRINSEFDLKKVETDFMDFDYPENYFDLIYFDAFGPRVQPELWEKELFFKIYNSMKNDGVLTTYSSKGSVRRIWKELGFEVKKHPGPPGKREMMTAKKIMK